MSDSPVKQFPYDQPIPRWAVDRTVSDTVSLAIATYDETISKPRHTENQAKFTSLENGQNELKESQDEVKEILTEMRGVLRACKWIGAVVGFAGTLLAVIHQMKY